MRREYKVAKYDKSGFLAFWLSGFLAFRLKAEPLEELLNNLDVRAGNWCRLQPADGIR